MCSRILSVMMGELYTDGRWDSAGIPLTLSMYYFNLAYKGQISKGGARPHYPRGQNMYNRPTGHDY